MITKTLSFAAIHFTVAFTVASLMSGSLLIGGAIALIEPVVNTIAYYFHERAWQSHTHHAGHLKQPALMQ